MNVKKLQFVIGCTPTKELLALLAEEAAELAQAALKLRRTMDDVNPTPVTKAEAMDKLLEEIADVQLMLKTLGLDDLDDYDRRKGEKLDRWAERLELEE